MKKFTKKKLGDILIEAGLINQEQLNEALTEQKKSGKKLGVILTEKGFLSSKSIYEVLEAQMCIPYVNLSNMNISPEVVRMIPENMSRKYGIVPIELINGVITVASSDPLNSVAFDDVRIFTGYEVQTVIADEEKVGNLIERFSASKKAIDAVEEFSKANNIFIKSQVDYFVEAENLQEISDSPAVKLINVLLEQAYQINASDIHIEPQYNTVRIRFRIDGQLQDIMKSDISILSSLVSRVKVMAGLNIAEKRLPQDGRATYKYAGNEIDLRISVLPTVFGEKVVIRVISKETFNILKEKLGFLPENLKVFTSMLKNPHGVILVTGPTGSGKTTTLYAAVKELNKPNVNIVTVEDPIESIIEGISQVQINPKAGLDFSNSLRSILRQDPDIMLIGEIRDSETSEIAVRAAITGHLVLSTLHTNDAASSVLRLIDMGIQPFLVSTSLVGVIAQRLVRRICPSCKTAYTPSDDELNQFRAETLEKPLFYKGIGCEICKDTGYKGRIAVHEIMEINSDLRNAIYKGESSDVLRKIARDNGMITMRENCKRLVLQGTTTFEEMIKVAYLQEK